MEEAVALYDMAANNYLLHLYYLNKNKKVKKRNKRRWWMLSIHKNRTKYFMDNMFTELTAEPDQFFNFVRMSTSDFEILLQKLAPYITKQDTKFRMTIPAKVRLAVALRYLATGDNFRSLHYLFKISHQLISEIVHEVCAAILIVLKDEVKMPVNDQEWLGKEAEFHDIFPHCLAAMEGKRVVTLSPINSGSEYFNYKHTYSIVLLALVDRNYHFMFADIGCQGRISDGGVFRNSSLFRALGNNTLNLPTHSTLLDYSNHAMPYVFVADNAFPLHTNIMKPYPGDHHEGSVKRIYNRQLSRARIIVENVFGVMTAVFRVLRKPISLQPDRASNVVMACVLLHNFLRNSRTSNNFYTPPGFMDSILDGEVVLSTWRQEQQADGALRSLPAVARRSALMPMQIRDKFAEYFATRYN